MTRNLAIWLPVPRTSPHLWSQGPSWPGRRYLPSFFWPAVSPPPTGDWVRRGGALRALSALGTSCDFRGIITVKLSPLGASSRLSTVSHSCQRRGGESLFGEQKERAQGQHSLSKLGRWEGKKLTLKEHLLYTQDCAGIFNRPCAVGTSTGAKTLPKVTQLGNGLYGRRLVPRAVGLHVIGGPWYRGPTPEIFQSPQRSRCVQNLAPLLPRCMTSSNTILFSETQISCPKSGPCKSLPQSGVVRLPKTLPTGWDVLF